ncbi:MAG: MBL fold metallo-hydrolase, partial [Proteobacteria bacterium]|nr:MBL fold metallo-hydrolase [Pseudomonadota bacterium]
AAIDAKCSDDGQGYIPLLVKNGFTGPVLSTEATRDLCSVLLPDSGYLQEKDADFANRHSFSKHKPALPLYTQKDAQDCLDQFQPCNFDDEHILPGGTKLRFRRAGHILGAAILEIDHKGTRIVFSGDLGRPADAMMVDPVAIRSTDYLVVESTYGDRLHEDVDPEDAMAEIIVRAAKRGGTVLIPSFAVGRAQALMFHLKQLKLAGRIPNLPVFLDSPMAVKASNIFLRHTQDHRLSEAEAQAACDVAHYVGDVAESKALDAEPMPKVIISASGMATGGRVLHHLKSYARDARNTILFVGFQAGGTRGAAMVAGADAVKIHGQYVPIKAEVHNLQMLSAHADQSEILSWLGHFEKPPKTTFITHGEPAASDTLRLHIEEDLGWNCVVPEYKDKVRLD